MEIKVIALTVATMALAVAIAWGWLYLNRNWNWLVLGHHPDTLRIRCEQEQKGVLIGNVCFKRDAVLWREGK
jgi:hypothetical protein